LYLSPGEQLPTLKKSKFPFNKTLGGSYITMKPKHTTITVRRNTLDSLTSQGEQGMLIDDNEVNTPNDTNDSMSAEQYADEPISSTISSLVSPTLPRQFVLGNNIINTSIPTTNSSSMPSYGAAGSAISIRNSQPSIISSLDSAKTRVNKKNKKDNDKQTNRKHLGRSQQSGILKLPSNSPSVPLSNASKETSPSSSSSNIIHNYPAATTAGFIQNTVSSRIVHQSPTISPRKEGSVINAQEEDNEKGSGGVRGVRVEIGLPRSLSASKPK